MKLKKNKHKTIATSNKTSSEKKTSNHTMVTDIHGDNKILTIKASEEDAMERDQGSEEAVTGETLLTRS